MLTKTYKRAVKAGGAEMPVTKYARIFGNDSALRKNVLRACANPRLGAAIEAGTFGDHRVIESLMKMGDLAARIVLDVEAKLGRKLTRARIKELTEVYLDIRARAEFNQAEDVRITDMLLQGKVIDFSRLRPRGPALSPVARQA